MMSSIFNTPNDLNKLIYLILGSKSNENNSRHKMFLINHEQRKVKLNQKQTHSGEKSSSIISQSAQPKPLNRWQWHDAKIFQKCSGHRGVY